jgi:hypothetical protein
MSNTPTQKTLVYGVYTNIDSIDILFLYRTFSESIWEKIIIPKYEVFKIDYEDYKF